MKISDFIFRIAGGLFFSIIYITISYIGSYFSIYWEWKCGVGSIWFMIGFITYFFLFEQNINTTLNVLGVILNIGLIVFHNFQLEPQLWIYIMLNIIVCSNIITTCIRRK